MKKLLFVIVAVAAVGAVMMVAGMAAADKVTICHKDPQGGANTITVAQSAVAAHMAHGDTMGACPISPVR